MMDQKEKETSFLKDFFHSPKKRAYAIAGAVFLLLVLTLALLLIFVSPASQTPPPVTVPSTTDGAGAQLKPVMTDDEMRGVYIATVSNINFPSKPGLSERELKEEVDSMVETVVSTGFDTVFFQVRPTGDAFYESQVFPTSRYLVSSEGDPLPFDVLQYLITRLSEYEVDVVAWVNPYRITSIATNSKEEALGLLSSENPAFLHPEWTVFYDGRLYYDPALPEVRDLICQGLEELCQYDVKGVLYDDYFYPYPVAGKTFDDSASYQTYGKGMELGDWRRDNVNQMVEKSYRTVKAIDPDKTFGVSPFGIWQNESSDPRGSDTKGQEAYSAVYADALAWIEGEYIDYISPQIYWERGNSAADFATLTRWWSAQVDGTSVKLIISHAAYKVGTFEQGADEIVGQIRYARAYMGSVGNIQYGFADIQKNTAGIRQALTTLYEKTQHETEPTATVTGVKIARPYSGYRTQRDAQFVLCASDPEYPVYLDQKKIGRTKSGFFSIYIPLVYGKNTLTLIQNGILYPLSITRMNATAQSPAISNGSITSYSPVEEGVLIRSGETLLVSVDAPSGGTVTVRLDDQVFTLRPTLYSGYLQNDRAEHYEGTVTAPTLLSGQERRLGRLTFTASYGSTVLTKNGPEVTLLSKEAPLSVTVTSDYSYLKVSPDSSFYDDPIPASVGMQDTVTAYYDGYYRLSCGYFIHQDSVLVAEECLSTSHLSEFSFHSSEKSLTFKAKTAGKAPIDVSVQGNLVEITYYEAETHITGELTIPVENCLFSQGRITRHPSSRTVKVFLTLKDSMRYYGFRVVYEEDGIALVFRKPLVTSSVELPLDGMTVVVDAGHGGSDPGALGFRSDLNEKDLNLKIALALKTRLEELGATVVMTRRDDSTVSLEERMNTLIEISPDFSISVHHNSTDEGTDSNLVGGTLGLYWSPAGKSLADAVTHGVAHALGTPDLGYREQMLALCRNHRFPQALVEVSFICSPTEYEMAVREEYADQAASGIVAGILSWIQDSV